MKHVMKHPLKPLKSYPVRDRLKLSIKIPGTMLVSARIDTADYAMLAEAAKRNNRSLAGEIRNRILGTTTAVTLGK